jgi:hypothetical protein
MTHGHHGKQWANNPYRRVGETQLLRVMRAEKDLKSTDTKYSELAATHAPRPEKGPQAT